MTASQIRKFTRKILHRNSTTASEVDAVFQSWLLQLPPARGLKKYLFKSHWRWAVFRYVGPQEGIIEFYANDRCTRMTCKIRITRKDKVESGMSFNPGVATNQLNMFSISSGRQVHYLVAETQREAEHWVFALCSACGLDMPQKSTPYLESRCDEQERQETASLSAGNSIPAEPSQTKSKNSDYILLSSCFSSRVPVMENTESEKRESYSYAHEKNLCLSSHHVNYDRPKPPTRRSRLMTSPDLRGNYSYPRTHRRPSNPNFSHTGNSSDADHEILPEIYHHVISEMAHSVQNESANSPNSYTKRSSRPDQLMLGGGKSFQELKFVGKNDSLKDVIHTSSSLSDFTCSHTFLSDVIEDATPPRPPKPSHLCQIPQHSPTDSFMIHADLVFPIYDRIPKPRKVLQNNESQMGCFQVSSKDTSFWGEHNDVSPSDNQQAAISYKSFVRCPSPEESSVTHIKVSPNTRVSRPLGGLWDNRMENFNDVYSHPKTINPCFAFDQNNSFRLKCDNDVHSSPKTVDIPQRTRTGSSNSPKHEIPECYITSKESNAGNCPGNLTQDPKKGVKMRRRPPTPPTAIFGDFALQPFSVDLKTTAALTDALDLSSKRKQMRPLTQEQRFSISKEMNYLDLAFVSNEQEYSNPRPLTRETVYYSVDFIRTWAFNATRKDVEEIYRNMQDYMGNK